MTDTKQTSVAPDAAKKRVHRSPNYPAINLETAINRARTIHQKEGRHPCAASVAMSHWGYKNPTSSNAQGSLSAVIKFGLLKNIGQGKGRQVQLTEEAIKILLDERPESLDRDKAIRSAALMPQIHKELWAKWGASLPSEPNMRTFLLMEKEFNSAIVDEFIKDYKATIAFAKLDKSEESGRLPLDSTPVMVGSFVQWNSNGVEQFAEPRMVRDVSEDGEWALLEGSETGVPMSELTTADPPKDKENPKPPESRGQRSQNPFMAKPREPDGLPPITFPLPNGNSLELRIKKPVTKKDWDRIVKLVELSEGSFVIEEPVGSLSIDDV